MSLKSVRLQKILELIEKNRIDTQEQLQQLLRRPGKYPDDPGDDLP